MADQTVRFIGDGLEPAGSSQQWYKTAVGANVKAASQRRQAQHRQVVGQERGSLRDEQVISCQQRDGKYAEGEGDEVQGRFKLVS